MLCSPLLMISRRSIYIIYTLLSITVQKACSAQVYCIVICSAQHVHAANGLILVGHCQYSAAIIYIFSMMDKTHPQILQNLLKLSINDLSRLDVAVKHFQLLVRQPIRSPFGIIEPVPKLGLQQDKIKPRADGAMCITHKCSLIWSCMHHRPNEQQWTSYQQSDQNTSFWAYLQFLPVPAQMLHLL